MEIVYMFFLKLLTPGARISIKLNYIVNTIKMHKPKVLITNSNVSQIAVDLLSVHFEVICGIKDCLDRSEILAKLPGVFAVLWSSYVRVDKEVLDIAGPQLKVISSMSAGVDHIDVKELKSRGILLGNTQMVSNNAVAEIAVLLTLAASRRLNEAQLCMHNGTASKYPVNWLLGYDLCGAAVGIVGLGGIGQAIVKRLQTFDVARFIYCGHTEKPEGRILGATFVSFEELLRNSDVVIVSCPLTNETKLMFNERAFKMMKKTAVFVNIARGQIVDQPALIKALERKTIFAAGLDVTTPDPLPSGHKMFSLPNCVLLPHLGSETVNTRSKMAEIAAKNIIAVFKNQPMPSPL